MFITSK